MYLEGARQRGIVGPGPCAVLTLQTGAEISAGLTGALAVPVQAGGEPVALGCDQKLRRAHASTQRGGCSAFGLQQQVTAGALQRGAQAQRLSAGGVPLAAEQQIAAQAEIGHLGLAEQVQPGQRQVIETPLGAPFGACCRARRLLRPVHRLPTQRGGAGDRAGQASRAGRGLQRAGRAALFPVEADAVAQLQRPEARFQAVLCAELTRVESRLPQAIVDPSTVRLRLQLEALRPGLDLAPR